MESKKSDGGRALREGCEELFRLGPWSGSWSSIMWSSECSSSPPPKKLKAGAEDWAEDCFLYLIINCSAFCWFFLPWAGLPSILSLDKHGSDAAKVVQTSSRRAFTFSNRNLGRIQWISIVDIFSPFLFCIVSLLPVLRRSKLLIRVVQSLVD